jgi:hypothetical protein
LPFLIQLISFQHLRGWDVGFCKTIFVDLEMAASSNLWVAFSMVILG